MSQRRPEGSFEKIRAAALRLLARREHSRLELGRKLAHRDRPTSVIEAVLDDLADGGLQDDARFAGAFVRARVERGSGPLRIARELDARGVAPDTLRAALDSVEGDWSAVARRVSRKRFGAEPPATTAERAKRYRFLVYRGFTADQVRAALES